jgi:hypothetical protein
MNSGTAAINNLAGGSNAQFYLWANGANSYTTSVANGLTAGVWSVTKGIFLPGTPMRQIIEFIRAHVRARAEAAHERARVEL